MLGANIGTTTTAILAALASPGDTLKSALQVRTCCIGQGLCGLGSNPMQGLASRWFLEAKKPSQAFLMSTPLCGEAPERLT